VDQPGDQRDRKRARRAEDVQLEGAGAGGLPRGWRFRPEWAGRPVPGPAALQHIATFGSPRQVHHMNCNIVCSMDFTRDGMLLAAAGVAKQVGHSRPRVRPAPGSCAHPGRSEVRSRRAMVRWRGELAPR
jgi:hypothetical protein